MKFHTKKKQKKMTKKSTSESTSDNSSSLFVGLFSLVVLFVLLVYFIFYFNPSWDDLGNCYEICLFFIPFTLTLYTDTISVGILHILLGHWREMTNVTYLRKDIKLFKRYEKRFASISKMKNRKAKYEERKKFEKNKFIYKNSSRLNNIGFEIAEFFNKIYNGQDEFGVCVFVTFDSGSIQLLYKNSQYEKNQTLWKVVVAIGGRSYIKEHKRDWSLLSF
ncbi:unnamed protein product [Caenorhabditis brenneri]